MGRVLHGRHADDGRPSDGTHRRLVDRDLALPALEGERFQPAERIGTDRNATLGEFRHGLGLLGELGPNARGLLGRVHDLEQPPRHRVLDPGRCEVDSRSGQDLVERPELHLLR